MEVILGEQKAVFFVFQHVRNAIQARDGDEFADHWKMPITGG